MLSVRIICVGKLGEKFWSEAAREYSKRLSAYCKLEIIELAEQRIPPRASKNGIAAALQKEASLIATKIPTESAVIALCIEGKPLSSEKFAEKISGLMLSGKSHICFVIGGSHGLADMVKSRALLNLSMSPMTFPHHLARIMLLEQLYRVFNILSNGKYHK